MMVLSVAARTSRLISETGCLMDDVRTRSDAPKDAYQIGVGRRRIVLCRSRLRGDDPLAIHLSFPD